MKITVPKEWFAQSAKIEGDSEIGAGIPSFLRESTKSNTPSSTPHSGEEGGSCCISPIKQLGQINKKTGKIPKKDALSQRNAKEESDPAALAAEPHTHKASDEFVEAVLIAQFTREMSKPEFPLGHLRQNKLVYFAHRRADEDVAEYFSKLAAGPYSPWATYKGPEGIAQKNGYVKKAKIGNRVGFLTGDKISNIDQYVSRYPVCAAVEWVVRHFRFKRNEELELFATVDFAVLDLVRQRKPVTTANVKYVIATSEEWKAKLTREIFSDANITRALSELRELFPSTYP